MGPGGVLDVAPGNILELEAQCGGPGVEAVELVGPDGIIASARADGEQAAICVPYALSGPLWVAARAVGRPHPSILRGPAYAHTSPVYVDMDGRRVARESDARWCLDWLDRLQHLVERYGRYHSATHQAEVLATISKARAFYCSIARCGAGGARL
jgi:hypothetical protein